MKNYPIPRISSLVVVALAMFLIIIIRQVEPAAKFVQKNRKFCPPLSLSSTVRSTSPVHLSHLSQQNSQPNGSSNYRAQKPLPNSPPTRSSPRTLQTRLSRTRRTRRRSQRGRRQSRTTRRHIRRQRLNELLTIRKLRRLENNALDCATGWVECRCDLIAARVGCCEDLTGGDGG